MPEIPPAPAPQPRFACPECATGATLSDKHCDRRGCPWRACHAHNLIVTPDGRSMPRYYRK